jgi:hypothetical protein
LSVTNGPIQIGVPFHVSGQYFAPGTEYTFYCMGSSQQIILGSATADGSGNINADLTIRSDCGVTGQQGGATGRQIILGAYETTVTPRAYYDCFADFYTPALSVTNGPIQIGVPFHVSGQYFAPGTEYEILVSNQVLLGSVVADSSGSFSVYISVPFGTNLIDYGGGSTGHRIRIFCSESRLTPPSNYETYVEYQQDTVHSVYLMLNADPQANYLKGQQATFTITILNQLNPQLYSTLTLTIIGPGGYNYYDFQPISVSANSVRDYSFSWVVPDAKGTYIVETSLAPTQLTAYDAKWLQACEAAGGSCVSNPFSFGFANNILNVAFALFVLVWSQSLISTYMLVLLNHWQKNIGLITRDRKSFASSKSMPHVRSFLFV